ncbi:hypothetical protein CNR22_20500 [Sphingobacteriaceae bacterium]|nr:hypothetical protein CNR22_20500 [Sphingobacteriaceae bacterium]
MKKCLVFVFFYVHLMVGAQVPPVCFNGLTSANISTVGSTPREVCSADVNNDGKPDLITANEGSNNISVLIGSGTGSFVSRTNYTVGAAPRSVYSADFNSDGYPDLVTANSGTNTISVLFGSLSGTFATALNYSVGTAPSCVRGGDFNLDGNSDLAVSNSGSSDISVLLGSASGTFAAAVSYTTFGAGGVLCIADFNNDSNSDIVITGSGNGCALLLGSSTGTFASSFSILSAALPYNASCADLNVDGNVDLVVCDYGWNHFVVLLGTGTGTFSTPVFYPIPIGFGAIPNAIADYNGDGHLDIVTGNYAGHSVSLFLGNSTGSFTPSGNYQLTDQSMALIAVDLNSDGIPDLASCSPQSGKVTVIMNEGGNSLGSSNVYQAASFPTTLGSGDFNSDGKIDLVMCSGSTTMSILFGQGDGVFSPPVNYTVNAGAGNALVADFNNDTHPDIAITVGSHSISILLGSASGTFSLYDNYLVGLIPEEITFGDFNQDGNIDLASVDLVFNTTSILLGQGTGSFSAAITYTVGESTGIAAGDLNGDGYDDLAISLQLNSSVSVLFGSASGTFAVGGTFSVASSPADIKIADLNADLINDIVVVSASPINSLTVLVGLGSGSFAAQSNYATGNNPFSITTGDYNSDGIKDIVVANYTGATISVFLGTGNAVFAPHVQFTAGSSACKIISEDINNDAKADLVILNAGIYYLQIILNAPPTLTLSTTNIACQGNSVLIKVKGASTYTWNTGATTHSISAATSVITTYTVVGKTFGGCYASAVTTVPANTLTTTLPLPTVTANSGSICLAQNFTIMPSGANSYTISGGQAIVHPTVTTSYTVVGTNTLNGCISLPVSIDVTVVPLPVISASGGTVCQGKSFTLSPSGAASYTFAGGSAVVFPAATTSYSVIGSGTLNNCVSLPVSINVSVIPSPVINASGGTICSGQSFTLNPSGGTTFTFSSGAAVVSPSVTSSYSVTGTNSSGCVSAIAAVAIVTVNNLPVISVNSGTICSGQSFMLIPAGAATYTFSSGSSVVSPVSTTTFAVAGTNSLGCISSGSAISQVSVMPLPIISVNSGSVCAGNSFTFIASGADTFTYSGGQVVSPVYNSSYSITGSTSFGCISSVPAIGQVTVVALPVFSVSGNSFVCQGSPLSLIANGSATSYSWSNGLTGNLITFTPTASAAYSVTGFLNTCSVVVTKSLTVLNLPIISVNSGSVCAGESFTFNVSGANSYSYPGNSSVYSTANSTVVSVSGTDANGCVGAANSSITVNALPIINVLSTQPAILCLGETATLTAIGAETYAWSGGENTNPIVISPAQTQTITVTGTDNLGCTNSMQLVQNVDACLFVSSSVLSTFPLSIYPNPNAGEFTIESSYETSIQILNALGQLIRNEELISGKNKINLEAQPNGIYFVRCYKNGSQQTLKVIKQN